ncbi:hypothetical protein [Paenibacillus sp. FSL H7-0331]|uniref:hypothetical protein n=1 Tax=Paenibacillus sp. FSL H7-0331 TaxID=1920421 RepID=UPI00096BDC55|nr:hypothetical protein [Paenibacillus sp. FSL H7-0331]OME97822.1 hypothetical protein BK127_40235 [Paenibacillus sp. FSL H7-0331]
MDTIWQYSIRTLLGFILLLLLTRILGKKQLSQMTFFTYITGIALGNITGEMVLNKEIKVVAGITAMTMWTLLTIIIEQISLDVFFAELQSDGSIYLDKKSPH